MPFKIWGVLFMLSSARWNQRYKLCCSNIKSAVARVMLMNYQILVLINNMRISAPWV